MDNVAWDTVNTLMESLVLALREYNALLLLSLAGIVVGFLFLLFSVFKAIWGVHVHVKLGPVVLIFVAAILMWWNLPDQARGSLSEWIKTAPPGWRSVLEEYTQRNAQNKTTF